MKTLTVSELNQALIEKGFSEIYANHIIKNKWDADYFVINESSNGKSYLTLCKSISKYSSIAVVFYSKLKASEKKEVAEFLLSLK